MTLNILENLTLLLCWIESNQVMHEEFHWIEKNQVLYEILCSNHHKTTSCNRSEIAGIALMEHLADLSCALEALILDTEELASLVLPQFIVRILQVLKAEASATHSLLSKEQDSGSKPLLHETIIAAPQSGLNSLALTRHRFVRQVGLVRLFN